MRCYTQKMVLFTFTSCTSYIGLCYGNANAYVYSKKFQVNVILWCLQSVPQMSKQNIKEPIRNNLNIQHGCK